MFKHNKILLKHKGLEMELSLKHNSGFIILWYISLLVIYPVIMLVLQWHSEIINIRLKRTVVKSVVSSKIMAIIFSICVGIGICYLGCSFLNAIQYLTLKILKNNYEFIASMINLPLFFISWTAW